MFVTGTVPDEVARHTVAGVTGLVSDVVFADTLESALKLHPAVRKVLVVAEAPELYGYQARVRAALEPFWHAWSSPMCRSSRFPACCPP